MTRLALIALATAALIPTAAFAQNDVAEVRYDDLDLSTSAGAQTLGKRIGIAARQVCRSEAATGTHITNTKVQRECMANVRRQVETRLNLQGVAIARN